MTTECYDLVKEFHIKFNQPVFSGGITKEIRDLRIRLLIEELGETVVAWHEKGKILFADGLADLLYVTAGAAVSCLDGKVADRWETDASKPVPPVQLAMVVINLCNAIHVNHANDILSLQAEMVMDYIQRIAIRHQIPLRECFLEVHKSNMTKTPRILQDGEKGGFKGPTYQPPNLAPLLGF